jgi:aryl-alcohol dehydrogenase-like predicted oxidoreductase
MVRGGLARGVLADKGSIKYLDYNQQSVDLLLDKMKVFSNENTALNHIALQWILNNSAVTSVVQGMRTLEQVHDALALNRSTLLSQAELDEIGSVLNPNIYSDHR